MMKLQERPGVVKLNPQDSILTLTAVTFTRHTAASVVSSVVVEAVVEVAVGAAVGVADVLVVRAVVAVLS